MSKIEFDNLQTELDDFLSNGCTDDDERTVEYELPIKPNLKSAICIHEKANYPLQNPENGYNYQSYCKKCGGWL